MAEVEYRQPLLVSRGGPAYRPSVQYSSTRTHDRRI